LRADINRTTLDVGVQSAKAFLMLQERRRTATLVSEQIVFAREVVRAANARYAGATAPQSDLLRAEVEVARLEALARALVSEIRGAEAMLNTSLALAANGGTPPLRDSTHPHPHCRLLYFSMRGWAQTFLVLAALPFAIAGSVWLLAFMGYNLSTAVWVGLIAVAGVAAETGIVMVVYLDEAFARYQREGRIQTPENVDARLLKEQPPASARSS
jgi:AcrB/AcrD/AcrF family/Outer membrane efflux protein